MEIPAGHWFPIQNLPFVRGIHRRSGEALVGVRIGDKILDLQPLLDSELSELIHADSPLAELAESSEPVSEMLTVLSVEEFRAIRMFAYEILRAEKPEYARHEAVKRALVGLNQIELAPPMTCGAFVDFYSGIHHASNVGRMFRPEQPPLLPNYRHVPIAYNGRASSVVGSGTPIVRPCGQLKPADGPPTFGPTREMDFELEVGFYVGIETEMGDRLPIEDAREAMSGLVLVNDWSARDIQRWEYQPLGPFLAKSFATSVSPYLVAFDALDSFRVPGMPQDPPALEYLQCDGDSAYDIHLEVLLQTEKMREPQVICRSNTKHLYWSFAQQLAHQASNGTPLEFGDLLASGTISGPEEGEFGSMLELSWRGSKPIRLEETGEERTFLVDGDVVIMRGWAERDGLVIGLGEVLGKIEPASE